MSLISCETNLILTWPENCFMIYAPNVNQTPTFELPDTKLYVSVVTLSTQDNEKILQQLKSGFKRIGNWNIKFSRSKQIFVLSFKNTTGQTSYKQYYLPTVETIKDYQGLGRIEDKENKGLYVNLQQQKNGYLSLNLED